MKKRILICLIVLAAQAIQAQTKVVNPADSTENWNLHFQLTVVDQSHTSFKAAYSGQNSLNPSPEEALSLTTTLYFGRKLWKGGALYFNPEVSGGSGVSEARGMAGFANGETFRIGDPSPALYLGRLFYRQYIALDEHDELATSDLNQLKQYIPTTGIMITAGKFALSDLFDDNTYSHDPRTQFLNWALMSNGAWDYAANTRGYTDAIAVGYFNPSWSVKGAISLEPTYANGPHLDYDVFSSSSQTLEFSKNINVAQHAGVVRLLAFRNVTKAPAYRDVINNFNNKSDLSLDVINGKNYGGVKYGLGLNAEQQLSNNLAIFLRAGWNDGKTATWAFTEIDQTLSLGLNYSLKKWNRPNDNFGIATVINGISTDHRDFLNAGGYGFIVGDGKLTNYRSENIFEAFYSAQINKNMYLSADYQFVQNPAYNADRGPVSLFAIRAHIEF